MAEYKKYLSRGNESQLDQLPFVDGKLRFTVDTGRLFMDLLGRRVEITDFVKGITEADILNTVTPLPKLYLSSDTNKLFINKDSTWICLNPDSVLNAENATNDSEGNQINTTYAPMDSPILSGIPTTPTPASGDSSKQVANTEFVISAITSAVGEITKFETEILDTLPETGVKGTIYFIPEDTESESNLYIEYIWVNEKFEKIGITKIDLTGYLNNVEISGTGNAVTGFEKEGNKLTLKKDATFLTKHPSITTTTDTTTESPEAGQVLQVIDSIETDENGHITNLIIKNVTLPTGDSSGQEIDATYIKSISISGSELICTKGNGTEEKFTIQSSEKTKGLEPDSDFDYGDLDDEVSTTEPDPEPEEPIPETPDPENPDPTTPEVTEPEVSESKETVE